ncbi:PhzF family phenazine biosynthesis protein [Nesterenkonia sedimenti]|uniref:PhzF family phenazine biosynthesis protein n=1 Tax=Nesterenkonia sedimenti TaxID=1463632 RepID=UPI001E4A25A1|nr:PhzF family phenazine biosynthesis protein [Nesterenkonia sedimenti]
MTQPEVSRWAAFTSDPDGGNPAGVVMNAGGLTEGQMLGIAQEVGFSETAFIRSWDPPSARFSTVSALTPMRSGR